MRPGVKYLLVIVAGCAGLLIATAWFLLNVNQYSGVIQAQLEQQLGRRVTLGRMSLGLLPLRFQVESTVIAEDPNFGGVQPFVSSENLDVRVRLLPLLAGDVRIQSIELQRPSIELIKNNLGAWNFSTIGTAGPGSPQQTPEASLGSPGSSFTLGRLTIRDGQVAITDEREAQQRTVYDHIDLTLLDYAAGQPFAFDLAAHMQGAGAQEIRVEGQGGPLAADPANTPFSGTLGLNQVGIEGLKAFLNTEVLSQTAGSLSGRARLANQSGLLTAAGKLEVVSLAVNGLTVGYPITIDYDLNAKLAEGLVTINTASLQLGATPLSLAGSIDTSATPPDLNLSVKSGEVSIDEIARLASAFGVAFAPGTNVTGRISADVAARGSASSPALTGTVAGRGLNISGSGIPLPVDVAAVDLTFSPVQIRSNQFTATSGTTTLVASFALREYTSPAPSIDVSLKAPRATLTDIQSIARAYGVTGLDQIKGEGALNLDLRAAGSTNSLSSAEIIRALNGTIDLNFSPLRIAGFDAARELAVIGGFSSNAADQDFTDIMRLTGKVLVEKGVARTNDLQAQLTLGKLSGGGTADLATEALNLKLLAVLSKASSDQVGSTRVGGYMSTALSNNEGELVIPVIVTGTFKQPEFAPDVRTFVDMQRKRLLPTFDNPGAAVSGILGVLSPREKQPPNGAEPPPSPRPGSADTIKGVLDGLFGGRKAPAETDKK